MKLPERMEPKADAGVRRSAVCSTARINLPAGYAEFLSDIKERVRAAQIKAAVSVNRGLIQLYWDIGKRVVERQEHERWGEAVIESLAADLHRSFPKMEGFSARNLWRMRAFYRAYSGKAGILPQPVAEIPWGHNVVILEKIKAPSQRIWYARKTLEHGWSRNILDLQIETDLYRRQGKAVTNFRQTLPPPQSDLAQQTLKDPYVFDFLTLGDDAREREVEQGLIDHVQQFLLELGVGFAFVGRQVHLEVGTEDFYIDLLFYHLRLRCYVVVELKAVTFKPEFAGQLNFYLSAVDDRMRHPDDRPVSACCCASQRIG